MTPYVQEVIKASLFTWLWIGAWVGMIVTGNIFFLIPVIALAGPTGTSMAKAINSPSLKQIAAKKAKALEAPTKTWAEQAAEYRKQGLTELADDADRWAEVFDPPKPVEVAETEDWRLMCALDAEQQRKERRAIEAKERREKDALKAKEASAAKLSEKEKKQAATERRLGTMFGWLTEREEQYVDWLLRTSGNNPMSWKAREITSFHDLVRIRRERCPGHRYHHEVFGKITTSATRKALGDPKPEPLTEVGSKAFPWEESIKEVDAQLDESLDMATMRQAEFDRLMKAFDKAPLPKPRVSKKGRKQPETRSSLEFSDGVEDQAWRKAQLQQKRSQEALLKTYEAVKEHERKLQKLEHERKLQKLELELELAIDEAGDAAALGALTEVPAWMQHKFEHDRREGEGCMCPACGLPF